MHICLIISYTYSDEAPALATFSLLPVLSKVSFFLCITLLPYISYEYNNTLMNHNTFVI